MPAPAACTSAGTFREWAVAPRARPEGIGVATVRARGRIDGAARTEEVTENEERRPSPRRDAVAIWWT